MLNGLLYKKKKKIGQEMGGRVWANVCAARGRQYDQSENNSFGLDLGSFYQAEICGLPSAVTCLYK